ncbi:RES family NAD+ phosphorylase (plasmid) [Rhizobium leguminosarum]|uniref:RES family NAD+ phosphorylase n=1 Tax=Rhizobium leguminosarum TaxID=384 RepID=UPI00102FEBA5|nr:RES family NAD+ phosphorylase [Rhizobium leguminosarum]QIO76210.1 RES family NAD+ phosphorylase [Rhizobium leguminosarum bv. trifolii]QIO83227.1 RES family NAD+ phosphorylase [Rhizobium leguminosarum bv. trifolii]TAU16520.1 RES domain-containing protein [Rhizobium leguminosarum]TAU34786.1 RES domain-containing protein [Rhizobium leguminosarum]TAX44036.1 RES domain-containing protein [Rhizobium leguminosarum]
MRDGFAQAPRPSHRLIPSQFPPIGLFETVTRAADLEAVMELVGWTNDRLVADRIRRLPEAEWVYGTPNSSIVMAAFLHVAPGGMRFNGPDLGAWYGADNLKTAAAEVGHHLRREAVARGVATMARTYRSYSANLIGDYLDIRGEQMLRRAVYDGTSYAASQVLGEEVRSSGGAGILYDSVRLRSGVNIVAHRPRNIRDVVQVDHFEVTVSAAERRIDVRKLAIRRRQPRGNA